eukprot:COSAG01_NODE_39885_length_470_cov_19.832884_1_plen_39_part_10
MNTSAPLQHIGCAHMDKNAAGAPRSKVVASGIRMLTKTS